MELGRLFMRGNNPSPWRRRRGGSGRRRLCRTFASQTVEGVVWHFGKRSRSFLFSSQQPSIRPSPPISPSPASPLTSFTPNNQIPVRSQVDIQIICWFLENLWGQKPHIYFKRSNNNPFASVGAEGRLKYDTTPLASCRCVPVQKVLCPIQQCSHMTIYMKPAPLLLVVYNVF